MKQIILLLLTTLFAVSGSAGAPLPDTTATPLSYQTTTQLDPKTHIQRTTLDPQGYELEVYFEVPIFEESTQGGKSINAFFYELNEAFFTPDNENLKRIWEGITLHEVNATPYFYRWNAHVNTQTEQLVSVSIAYEWYAGGVVDYGSDSYTFRADTGEELGLLDVVEATDAQVREAIYTYVSQLEAAEEYVDFETLRGRRVEEFRFFVREGQAVVTFDMYE